ncbi:MAG TPA: Rrf2 family transcriptional regulator [Feifaniaceae bacterium]|nr:Rrf2 family transcriptional regulator [Feifaniaceae bacterium]
MKLSTRGRYGIKAMVDLAVEYGSGPVSATTLSNLQGVSLAYLEQLIASLKKARLIESVRGVQGGYTLARRPEEITVNEVLKALEGSTTVVDCVSRQQTLSCEHACTCSARPLWLKLQSRIDAVLDETTIKDMADDYILQMRRTTHESLS